MSKKQKHLIHELKAADYVTSLGLILIINAFWLLLRGHTEIAIIFSFASMYCDYLDGRIARKYGSSSFGNVMDSLYDVLGWVLFPSLVINIQTQWAWWSVLVTTIFCWFAILRLSRFTVNGYVETGDRYYTGMPVGYSAYALIASQELGAKLSVFILLVMIPLMVSSRLFKKAPRYLMQFNALYLIFFLWLYLK